MQDFFDLPHELRAQYFAAKSSEQSALRAKHAANELFQKFADTVDLMFVDSWKKELKEYANNQETFPGWMTETDINKFVISLIRKLRDKKENT